MSQPRTHPSTGHEAADDTKKYMWESLCSGMSVTCVAATAAISFISIVTAIVLAVSVTYSLSAADDFAESYSISNVRAATNKVNDFVKIPVNIFAEMRASAEFGSLPDFVSEPNASLVFPLLRQWTDAVHPMLFSTEFYLPYISMGFADHALISCSIDNMATLENSCIISNYRNESSRALLGYGWQTTEHYIGTAYSKESGSGFNYDPFARSWWINSPKLKGDNAIFSTPYVEFMTQLMVTDVTGPIFHKDGTFLGITSISLGLRNIASFLNELPRTSDNAISILLDEDGFLLGASDMGSMLVLETYDSSPLPVGCDIDAASNTKYCRLTPQTYENEALRELASKEPGILVNDKQSFTRKVKLNGEQWMVSKSAIVAETQAVTAGIDWQIITLMPVEDVTSAIVKGRDVAIIVAVVTIVVASSICGLVLYFLLRPLNTLSALMLQAAELKDDSLGATMDKSSMREIRAIQDSFERLSAQLKKAKSFLPASLLAQLESSGEDYDEPDEAISEGDYGGRGSGSETTPQGSKYNVLSTGSDGIGGGGKHNLIQGEPRNGAGRFGRRKSGGYSAAPSVSNASTPSESTLTTSRYTAQVPALMKSIDSGVSLSSRRVSILVLNLRHFHHKAMMQGSTYLELSYGQLVDQFQRIAKDHKGILDTFHGDRFHFTFNAVKPCGPHGASACATALKIAFQMNNQNNADHAPLDQPSHSSSVTCGVATGRCLVGNLGSDKAKRYTVIGPAFSHATVLERLCKRYKTSVLMSNETTKDCDGHIGFLFQDLIMSPESKIPVPIAAAKHSLQNVPGAADSYVKPKNITSIQAEAQKSIILDHSSLELVFGVKSAAGIDSRAHHTQGAPATDEWMYEMDTFPKQSNFSNGNGAFKSAMRSDWDSATKLMESFTDSSTEGNTLRARVEFFIKSQSTEQADLGHFYNECFASRD